MKLLKLLRHPELFAILAVIIMIIVLFDIAPSSLAEDYLRVAGFVLQFIGVVTVGYGLHNKRCLFEIPTLLQEIHRTTAEKDSTGAELDRRFLHIVSGLTKWGGSAEQWIKACPACATEKTRLEVLETQVKLLKEAFDRVQDESLKAVKDEQEERNKTVTAQKEIEGRLQSLQKKVEVLGVGDIHLEMTGVICLGFGLVFSSVPTLILCAMNCASNLKLQ